MFCPAASPPPPTGRWKLVDGIPVRPRLSNNETRESNCSPLSWPNRASISPLCPLGREGRKGIYVPSVFSTVSIYYFRSSSSSPLSQKGPPSGSPRLNGPDNGSLYRYFTATFFPTVYTILSLLGENGSRRSGTRGRGTLKSPRDPFPPPPSFSLSLSRLIYDQLELAAFCFSPRIICFSPRQSSVSIIFLRPRGIVRVGSIWRWYAMSFLFQSYR